MPGLREPRVHRSGPRFRLIGRASPLNPGRRCESQHRCAHAEEGCCPPLQPHPRQGSAGVRGRRHRARSGTLSPQSWRTASRCSRRHPPHVSLEHGGVWPPRGLDAAEDVEFPAGWGAGGCRSCRRHPIAYSHSGSTSLAVSRISPKNRRIARREPIPYTRFGSLDRGPHAHPDRHLELPGLPVLSPARVDAGQLAGWEEQQRQISAAGDTAFFGLGRRSRCSC